MIFNNKGIIGYDISTYQDSPDIPGTVDFQKMKYSGASFVGFRASNGIREDADFRTYRQNVSGILPWFAYHYYNNLYDPKSQAIKLNSILAPNFPSFVVLDLENKVSGYVGLSHWYNFLEEFKRLSGLSNDRIVIYTNETYINDYAGNVTDTQLSYLKKYKLWLASYVDDPIHPKFEFMDTPYPWEDWNILMVQTGTPPKGLDVGVESREVDYNIFNGDEIIFKQIFGEMPNIGEPMDITLTANLKTGNQSNLREAAGLSAPILQTLTGPLSIQGVGEKIQLNGYYWIQIVSPFNGWVALTTSYENVVYTPPVITPTRHKIEIYFDDVLYLRMVDGILEVGG